MLTWIRVSGRWNYCRLCGIEAVPMLMHWRTGICFCDGCVKLLQQEVSTIPPAVH